MAKLLCLSAGAHLLASLNVIDAVFYSLYTHLKKWSGSEELHLRSNWTENELFLLLWSANLLRWMWSLKAAFLRKEIRACSTTLRQLRLLSWETLWWANKAPVLNLVESRVSGRGDLDLSSGLCLTRTAWWIFMCRLAFCCRKWELFFLPWDDEHRASL